MCGADDGEGRWVKSIRGSPPRVRSRRTSPRPPGPRPGITSACAEQTTSTRTSWNNPRDHLRVCGADEFIIMLDVWQSGSPPRVRSRLHKHTHHAQCVGITSACAEQTNSSTTSSATSGDHLRVCGADSSVHHSGVMIWGSPPRVRSRLRDCQSVRQPVGITSACAEQTRYRSRLRNHRGDHLRVCGADWVDPTANVMRGGSPPRVRSRPRLLEPRRQRPGITSACAEQTRC